MFGYVAINEPELKIKDYRTYRGFYCGLCHALGHRHGLRGRVALNYDMTFLAILLTDLYDAPDKQQPMRCPLHPLCKASRVENEFIDYAADMTALLAYYQCRDHWQDDKKLLYGAEAALLRCDQHRLKEQYPRQYTAAERYVCELTAVETRREPELDAAAGLTGELLAEIYQARNDAWSAPLKQMGFFLGKFVYLMDAYEDAERDAKRGAYNPWLAKRYDDDYEQQVFDALTAMLAEAAHGFELLPIVEYADILRNVIYSGVWGKYERLRAVKENKDGSL